MSLKNEPFLLKTNVKHEYDKTQCQQGLHTNCRKFTSLALLSPQRFKRKNDWGMGVGIAGISSIVKQCELLSLHRSRFYYEPVLESAKNLIIMRWLDEQYFETPFYGGIRLQVLLVGLGYQINIKRIRRLMKLVVWRTLYQEPRTTIADKASYK